MNDAKYKNGLTKEEIKIDDGINTTEVVWKQEDYNIKGAEITGDRPSNKATDNSATSSSKKNSVSILQRFQNWFYKTFGIEVNGSNEGGEGYGRKGASDRKVDITKNPFNPKRIGIGKEPDAPDYFIEQDREYPGPVIPGKVVPQSAKQSTLDPDEKIWIPFTTKQIDGSTVGGMSLEYRKDSLKFVNSHN